MLLSRKKVGLISWSGIISILGVATGCFALIVSVAVLNGFEQEVRNKVIGFETDLRIMAGEDQIDMEKFAVLESEPGIVAHSPFIERKAVAISPNDRSLVKVKAVEMRSLQSVYKIEGIEITYSPNNKVPIYIGRGIADRLGMQESDRLRLMNPLDNQLYLGMPSVLDARVAGVFETRILDFDQTYVFLPITAGQALFKAVGEIDGIDLRLNHNADKAHLKEAVLLALGEDVAVSEVEEIHQTLFQAMKMEKLG